MVRWFTCVAFSIMICPFVCFGGGPPAQDKGWCLEANHNAILLCGDRQLTAGEIRMAMEILGEVLRRAPAYVWKDRGGAEQGG